MLIVNRWGIAGSMRRLVQAGVALLALAGHAVLAQDSMIVPEAHSVSTEFALTYVAEHANVAPETCGCFWLQGGGVGVSVLFFHGLGVAADFDGEHASDIEPGVGVSTISLRGGPSYSFSVHKHAELFTQALFGEVHGFDGLYPRGLRLTSSADALAMQFGGGLNLFPYGSLGVRAIEVSYVRNNLPNDAGNRQNDLRLEAGVTYRFHRP